MDIIKYKKLIISILQVSFIFAASVLATTSYAITAVQLPSSINPAYVKQRIPSQELYTPNDKLPTTLIELPSTLSTQTQKTFKLQQLKVTGATLFSNAQLEQTFKGYNGKNVSLADLQAMATQITQKYQSSRYPYTKAIVPPQQFKNGIATIQVLERK